MSTDDVRLPCKNGHEKEELLCQVCELPFFGCPCVPMLLHSPWCPSCIRQDRRGKRLDKKKGKSS